MTEELKRTIKKELSELPQEGQDAINAVDWVKIAGDIGRAHSLDEEEVDNLVLETLLVLIGVVDPEFYAINIENHVETTKETAGLVAQECFDKIFAPIRKILEENIKKSDTIKNPAPEQNVNFILSGGDYSEFLKKGSDTAAQ